MKIKKFLKQKKRKNKKYKGFSFIESILAISILSIGIVAVLELMTSSLSVSLEAKNYNIAVFLAQEGTELVRNVRDNDWSNFSSLPNKKNCKIDINSNSIKNSDCNNNSKTSGRRLYLNGSGFYTYASNGKPTKFYRKVELNKKGSKEYQVISMVIWGMVNNFPALNNCDERSHCTYAETTLKDWK